MKTKTFFLLCFIAAFAINTVNAQNRVIKTDEPYLICGEGQFVPCTGDYMCGWLTFQVMNMKNQWIVKIKNATIKGYIDPNGEVESGKVYEITQVANGKLESSEDEWHNHISYRMNGKLIGEVTFTYRVNINANGDVTAVIDHWVSNCMN
jgi:hypothetical protein